MTRAEKIMQGAAVYCAFYRANPARFAKDYLHLDLRLFQKIVITMMILCSNAVFIGARGIGKTFISAVFCVIRCILWPGTKVCIASGTRGQAINVLEKIMLELKPNSPELAAEIDMKETKINGTDAKIVFLNGSYIKVVTASDSSRGNRANVLILDEFRLISKDVIDTILRKFLTQRRMPKYEELTKAERRAEYDKEKNMTAYLRSAYYSDHWSYTKCQDTFKAMLDESKSQFVCSLPYQLSIEEGLLDADTVLDEMSETDFSDIKFSMEYEALFYGSSEDAFFDFASVSKNRRIKYPMFPDRSSGKLMSNANISIPPKRPGEKRILSVDIALMKSKKRKKKNDATAIFVNQMLPTKAGRYVSNIVYADGNEGMHTADQALLVRKLFDEYECDYLVIDANGVGAGVADLLLRDIPDPVTGDIYPAISCCNNQDMADRCISKDAKKVIWAIKATSKFNSDIAYLLREGFSSGRVRLLDTEINGETSMNELRGYSSLNPPERTFMSLPYVHTTLLIDELTKLQHEEKDGLVRVYERSGKRKDRYSSLAYNYWVACQVETKIRKRSVSAQSGNGPQFMFRAPKVK